MILSSEHLAMRLEAQAPYDSDPLIIAPRPDLNKLRKQGAASVDLRLGCWFLALKQSRSPCYDIKEKNVPSETALSKMHYVPFGRSFILHPRSFVLGSTLEWVRLPVDIAGYVTSRSSWGRRGLIIATATGVHPHFTGCLTLELFNSGEIPVALYPGVAICQFFMHQVHEPSKDVTGGVQAGRRKPYLSPIKPDPVEEVLLRLNQRTDDNE